METLIEVSLWLLGEIFWKLVIPYLVIFGGILGFLRFCTPTWHAPTVLSRIGRSIAWGLDLGWGNNNRRGWFLFPLLTPFILYWGFSQPLGPPSFETSPQEAAEISGFTKGWDQTLHSFHMLTYSKREADRRQKERETDRAVKKAAEPGRRDAIIKERHKDWSRYIVGRTVAVLWVPFVILYGLVAGREEISGWAQGIVASRRTQQVSTAPTPATSGSPVGGPASTPARGSVGPRILGALGIFELAEILLHFYRIMPGGRR